MENYYDVLNINQYCDTSEIKKAYRKLSLQYHPDRNIDNNTKDIFNKINTAYEVLSCSDKRELYDKKVNKSDLKYQLVSDLKNQQNNNISNNETPYNQNYYENLNIYKNIIITYEQAYSGYYLSVNIEKWRLENKHKVYFNETIYVDVKKGIDNNEIITIENKGNYLTENNIGKLILTINLKNHEIYNREGLDLIYKKEITLKDALCGFSFNLQHLDDNNYIIKNEKGNIINNNYKKVIKHKGFERDNIYGNLIIEFNVVFPSNLNFDQIDQLLKIL